MSNDTPPSDTLTALVRSISSRRDFLRTASITVGAGALAACSKSPGDAPVAATTAAPATTPPAGATGGTMGAHDTAKHAPATTVAGRADQMDAMHEKGVKAFPARTAGQGNQLLQPRVENGVKIYDLTAKVVQWEVEPGRMVEAWTYNGVVPAPQIRVRVGDRVRILLRNELPESTAIHFHGLEVPNDQDGVPFLTQPPVKPGTTYTYEFTVPNSGSHMYHAHHNAAKQVSLGLLGAFIVEPRRPRAIEKVDVDYVMILNDGAHGYTLNGKGFPATEPIVVKLGQKLRVRYMNEGMMIHPMHLHGMHQTVIEKDGWPLPQPYKCDTVNIAPGERFDVIVNCNNPGTWAFHCHILPHAESEHGMFGMVTALIVQK